MGKEEIKEQKDEGKLIRISKEADDALVSALQKVNDGAIVKLFKVDMASFILEKYTLEITEEDIKELQMKSLNEVDLLHHVYKRALDSGVIPDNLREILYLNAGLTPSPKKNRKSRQVNGINDTIQESVA